MFLKARAMPSTTKQAPRQRLWYQVRRNIWSYVFISPFFVLFAVFGLFPFLYAFYLSLVKWDGLSPQVWVGIQNYQRLFADSTWWKSVFNTVWLLIAVSLNLVLAFVLAFILNLGVIRFKNFFRTTYFLPIVASSVAVAILFRSLYGTKYGILNYLLSLVSLPPVDWLGTAIWIKPAIAIVVIWRWFGFNTVIYLAGLQAIPVELYDAARIDGAGWRDIFWRITLPLMRPFITFTAILTVIGAMQLFEEPMMLVGGGQHSVVGAQTGPGGTDQAGLTVMMNLYATAFQNVKFGYSAAMSVALFFIIVTFSYIYFRLLGRNLNE